MWALEKLRDISLDLSSFLDKHTEEEVHVHQNILTPDKIPEFCLPPRLRKDVPKPLTRPASTDPTQNPNLERSKAKKSLSAESYGLTGIYERPNTRRKESLFLSKRPVYSFDRSPSGPGAPQSGSVSSLSENTSSSDSSPLGSPRSRRPAPSVRPLRGATSCPSLTQILKGSPRPLTLSPPALFPLDVLQCQEKLQREHVLPLEGRGTVRFSIERTSSLSSSSSSSVHLLTVRLRVVSVEDTGEALSCGLRVCLMPGRLQRQKSATVRQSRGAVFNEDFFFTELSEKEVEALQLRVKVVDKAGAGSLRRAALVGVLTKPLALLL